MEYVTLVDTHGKPIGVKEKIEAHRGTGLLHLAFSIFIFNKAGDFLLQKRADHKYHFAGLWSNSCCGHPLPRETVGDAASRRLQEELGFTTELSHQCTLTYEAHDWRTDLTEKEFLHIFTGEYEYEPTPSAEEVGDWRWLSADALQRELHRNPDCFTPWFRLLMAKVELDKFDWKTAFQKLQSGAR